MSHQATPNQTARPPATGQHFLLGSFLIIALNASLAWSEPKKPTQEALMTLHSIQAERWGDSSRGEDVDEDGNPLRVRMSEPNDDRLAELVQAFPKLEMIFLSRQPDRESTLSLEGLRHIERLPALKSLWLRDAPLTDQRAEVVSRLTRLKDLSIKTGTITKGALSRFLI